MKFISQRAIFFYFFKWSGSTVLIETQENQINVTSPSTTAITEKELTGNTTETNKIGSPNARKNITDNVWLNPSLRRSNVRFAVSPNTILTDV